MTTTALRHALAACLCLVPLALHAAQPPNEIDAARPSPERGLGPSLQSPPPKSADPFSEELTRLIEEARSRENTPELALTLLNAFELRQRLPNLAPLAQLMQRHASSRRADPRVQELASMLLARVERSRGRLARAEAELKRLGFVDDFWVVGPFDNEGKGGCALPLPPESEIDLAAEYTGKSRKVRWQRLPSEAPALGRIDLDRVLTPDKEVLSYAFTEIDTQIDQAVLVSLSASGAFQLFIDGQRVFQDEGYHPSGFEQARLLVNLPKGRHQILLKLCQADGTHDFAMRLKSPTGRALRQLKVVPPEPGTRLAHPNAPKPPKNQPGKPSQAAVQVERLDTLADTFRQRAKDAPKDATALLNHAEIARFFHPDDDTARTATVESAKAAELRPNDTRVLFSAARLADDWNEERRLLQKILELSPGHPRASERLAKRYADHQRPWRALELIDAALERHPRDFPLNLDKALLLASAFDLTAQAEKLVEDTFNRWRDRPETLWQMALVRIEQGRPREAVALLRTLLSLSYADLGARRQLAATLADLGDLEGAIEERRRILALDPWNSLDWLRLGELTAANGRTDLALEALGKARSISAADPRVHERAGHALALLGRTEEAIEALTKSLDLKPQNPRVQEALKALKGEQKGFGEAFARDAAELMATHPPRAGEDAVILSQLTAIKVHPSGLASRFHQLIARAQTERGVDILRQHWVSYADDRQALKILAARIHRPDGSIRESFTQQERSLSDPSTRLFYDARARLIRFPALSPGDTLELTYRLDDTAGDNLLSDYFGDVRAVQGELFKERFDYLVEMPAGRDLFAGESRIALDKSEETLPDGGKRHRFSAREVPRFVPEPGMPGAQELVSLLHVSTYETWDEVARYYDGLIRDQLAITPAIREAYADIVAPLSDPRDERAIIRAVYDFVVSRTRYVGLEFGIHSFKPYPVDKVLARRFGDCKDKASLMHALLKVGGIDSRITLLRMKRRGQLADYPASLAVFDHAILYIPGHDLFLDGTAEHHGTGELPSQDTGASVLVVDPTGPASLATIPELVASHNSATAIHEVEIAASGEARLKGHVTRTGQLAPTYRRTYLAEAGRAQIFSRSWSRQFPGLSVRSLDVSDPAAIESPFTLAFDLSIPGFARPSSDGLVVLPLGQRQSYVAALAPLSSRKLPLQLPFASTQSQTFRLSLPEGHAAQKLPPPVTIDTPHLAFERRCERLGDGRLEFTVRFTLKTARVETADYAAFREALSHVDAALSEGIRLDKISTQASP